MPASDRDDRADSQAIDRRAEQLMWRGQWDDAGRLVAAGLDDARARGDRAGVSRLLLRRGRIATDKARHRGGDRSGALADLEAARRDSEAIGDAALTADCIDALGMHRYTRWYSTQDPADLAASEQLFRQALALRAPGGDSSALAESNFHIGLIHQMRGEPGPAAQAFERALAIAERVADDVQISHATRHLGYLAQLRRDWGTAEAYYRRSLEPHEAVGAGPSLAAARVTLAELRYARTGEAEPALALLGRAHQAATAGGSTAYVAITSAAIARVERDHGRHGEALRRLDEAISALAAMHSDEGVPENLEQIALIHLLRDQPAAARAAVDRAIAIRSSARLVALQQLIRARSGAPPTPAAPARPVEPGAGDAVVTARLALAAGDPEAAVAAAVRGDDPDTLLLAARARGAAGWARAIAAAQAMSPAQAGRFARERAAASP